MEHDKIQYQLDEMVKAILAKKLERPTAFLQISSNSEGYLSIVYYDEGEYCPRGFWGKEPYTVINEAWDFIREIQDSEDRARERYFRKVADAVEYGRSMGVDQTLINPLLEQMKKLSSNIIEHQPTSEDYDRAARARSDEFNDGIPF